MVSVIFLTQGYNTVVDSVDYDSLTKHRWHICKASYSVYACRHTHFRGVGLRVYMHREIVRCPPGHQVHHLDGNTLNNTRANLEICSQAQNLKYRKKGKKS